MSETQSKYNYRVVRQFTVMSVIWGIVGMLVGVIIAAQLVWPELNIGFLHFGRLRPLHTNAVIFAFGGWRADGNVLLRRAANLPHPTVFRRTRCLRFLGLAAGHRPGGDYLAARFYARQGIRRT